MIPDTFADLFWGYTVLWAIIVFFLFRLMREQYKARTTLEKLEQKLSAEEEPSEGKVSQAK